LMRRIHGFRSADDEVRMLPLHALLPHHLVHVAWFMNKLSDTAEANMPTSNLCFRIAVWQPIRCSGYRSRTNTGRTELAAELRMS
jgi:hypothetical protein